MRKVELSPTRNGEAGYGPGVFCSYFIYILLPDKTTTCDGELHPKPKFCIFCEQCADDQQCSVHGAYPTVDKFLLMSFRIQFRSCVACLREQIGGSDVTFKQNWHYMCLSC